MTVNRLRAALYLLGAAVMVLGVVVAIWGIDVRFVALCTGPFAKIYPCDLIGRDYQIPLRVGVAVAGLLLSLALILLGRRVGRSTNQPRPSN